jgi:hypothetical protein
MKEVFVILSLIDHLSVLKLESCVSDRIPIVVIAPEMAMRQRIVTLKEAVTSLINIITFDILNENTMICQYI